MNTRGLQGRQGETIFDVTSKKVFKESLKPTGKMQCYDFTRKKGITKNYT
jgi:hypothetical protein